MHLLLPDLPSFDCIYFTLYPLRVVTGLLLSAIPNLLTLSLTVFEDGLLEANLQLCHTLLLNE